MAKILGIDFGTTNSCMAIWEKNEIIVIPNAEGCELRLQLLLLPIMGMC